MRINRPFPPTTAMALLEQALGGPLSPTTAWRPRLQISETDQGAIARLELPGFSKDSVEISIEKDTVTVSAKQEASTAEEAERVIYTEFTARAFERSFTIGFEINAQSASAKMDNGVLSIELPKSETAMRKAVAIQ